MVYTFIPSFVGQRVITLRSRIRPQKTDTYFSLASDPSQNVSRVASGTRTPPPPYTEILGPLTTSSGNALIDSKDQRVFLDDSATPSNTLPVTESADDGSVQWKFASQGLSLLTLAAQEASSRSQATPFHRQLYIHALTYLLQGLPRDLSAEERLSLRCALPETLRDSDECVQEQNGTAVEAGYLHRAVAAATLQIFVLISIVLPYIQALAQMVYRYEKEHRVSERVFKQTACAADVLGKSTFAAAKSIRGLQDGRVGEVLDETATWWMQGVSEGIYEGVGEGMQVIGLRSPVKGKARRPRAV